MSQNKLIFATLEREGQMLHAARTLHEKIEFLEKDNGFYDVKYQCTLPRIFHQAKEAVDYGDHWPKGTRYMLAPAGEVEEPLEVFIEPYDKNLEEQSGQGITIDDVFSFSHYGYRAIQFIRPDRESCRMAPDSFSQLDILDQFIREREWTIPVDYFLLPSLPTALDVDKYLADDFPDEADSELVFQNLPKGVFVPLIVNLVVAWHKDYSDMWFDFMVRQDFSSDDWGKVLNVFEAQVTQLSNMPARDRRPSPQGILDLFDVTPGMALDRCNKMVNQIKPMIGNTSDNILKFNRF